jgi:PAS domain S-box-containing protein
LHPDDREDVRRAVATAIDTGSLFDVEYRTVSRETGAVKWVRAVGKAIYGPGGEPVHFDGITRDVTTRRLAEDRLRQSEQHLRLLSNTVPALISYIGPDGRYRACNDAYTAWFGLPREQIVGRHMREVLGEAAWQAVGGYYERARAGQSVEYEAEVNYRHGGARWIHAVYTPHVGAAGDVEGLIVLVTDVSASKRAAEALRRRALQFETLVHAAPLGIYLVDSGFRILQVNPVAAPLFAAVAGGAIGRDLAEVMRQLWEPEDAETFVAIFRHGLRSGESYVNPEYAARRRGRAVPEHYEWRLDRITLPDGGHGVVCYFRDISAQVQARAALEEADRRKDEFLATLAHELRNPLAPLRNGLQVLKLARPGDAAADAARAMMERQLRHMVRLIDDLMDVSRISRGKVELRRERIELAKVVHQAVETSRPLLEADGHELDLRVPDEPVYVDADLTRLAQVFANLLNNAAKYTEPGGRVTLSVAREGGTAVVAVRDTGVGIPAAMLPRVFDLFTQVDRSLEKRQGGLGIGLSLVKRLVELHGGTVEAHSDGPGHGSEFRVRLPLVLALAEAPTEEGLPPAAAPGRRRVLVVDDNRDAALSLAMLLRIMGNETRAAHDGVEALDVAAGFRPDVVILDIGMPRLNGYETCRRFREQPGGRAVVLVALTGWGAADDRERSREAGFDAHLVKPVDPEALEELLTRLRASSA